MPELSEDGYRVFVPVSWWGDDVCDFCPDKTAIWLVLEKSSGDQMLACDRHQFTAFS